VTAALRAIPKEDSTKLPKVALPLGCFCSFNVKLSLIISLKGRYTIKSFLELNSHSLWRAIIIIMSRHFYYLKKLVDADKYVEN
jgi:hypothetical protein